MTSELTGDGRHWQMARWVAPSAVLALGAAEFLSLGHASACAAEGAWLGSRGQICCVRLAC